MSRGCRHPALSSRSLATGLVVIAAGLALALALAACQEVEETHEAVYVPSELTEIEESDSPRVSFTEEGARRTGLRTAAVKRNGAGKVVPYEALIYDAEGGTYVYQSPEPLTYRRVAVDVDRIEGERVLFSGGPPVGMQVVTVGAAEVHGAELEVAG